MQRIIRVVLGLLVSIVILGCTRDREDACARGVTEYLDEDETRACCSTSMTGDSRMGLYRSAADVQALRRGAHRCAYVARVNTLAFYDADGCTSNGLLYHVAVMPVLRLVNEFVETVVVAEANGGVPPEDDLRFLTLYIAADDLVLDWRNTEWAWTHGGTYDADPELPGLCFNPAEGEEI